MKIGTRLTILFTSITGLVLGGVLGFIYVLMARNAKDDFFERLRERAVIAATVFLEQDELTRHRLLESNRRFLVTLPYERILIIDRQNRPQFVEAGPDTPIPHHLVAQVRRENLVRQCRDSVYTTGLYYHDNQGDFVILVSAVDAIGNEKLADLRFMMTAGLCAGIVLMTMGGFIFSRRILRPVSKIVTEVHSISSTNLDHRIDVGDGRDEIAQLASTFNEMLERLQASFERQRLFVANASHELRTPLTSIIGEIQVVLARPRTADEYKTTLLSIASGTEHLNAIVNGLLLLARSDGSRSLEGTHPVRVDECLLDAIDLLGRQYDTDRLRLHTETMPEEESHLTIDGHEVLVAVVLTNIIDNALKYSEDKPIDIYLESDGTTITITIEDDGIGFDDTAAGHVADPFFRTDDARLHAEGHGIGLAVTESILHHLAGTIDISSGPAEGTTVIIRLPASTTKR